MVQMAIVTKVWHDVQAVAVYSIDNNPDAKAGKEVPHGAYLSALHWAPSEGLASIRDAWSAIDIALDVLGSGAKLGLAAFIDGKWIDTDGGSLLEDF